MTREKLISSLDIKYLKTIFICFKHYLINAWRRRHTPGLLKLAEVKTGFECRVEKCDIYCDKIVLDIINLTMSLFLFRSILGKLNKNKS